MRIILRNNLSEILSKIVRFVLYLLSYICILNLRTMIDWIVHFVDFILLALFFLWFNFSRFFYLLLIIAVFILFWLVAFVFKINSCFVWNFLGTLHRIEYYLLMRAFIFIRIASFLFFYYYIIFFLFILFFVVMPIFNRLYFI